MRGLDQDPQSREHRGATGRSENWNRWGGNGDLPYKSLVLISFLSAEANAIPPRPMHSDGRPIFGTSLAAAIGIQITAGLQVSLLLGLFPSFASQFDGGTSFALRGTSI